MLSTITPTAQVVMLSKDIASISMPTATLDEPDLTKADTRHALAMAVLKARPLHWARSIPRSLASRRSAASTLTPRMPKSPRLNGGAGPGADRGAGDLRKAEAVHRKAAFSSLSATTR